MIHDNSHISSYLYCWCICNISMIRDNIMTKTFDIYFSVRIKAENFSDVTSKMSNIYQNIRNSINDEATLKFVHVELDEVDFSAIHNGGYQRH